MTAPILLDPTTGQSVTLGFTAAVTALGPVTVQPHGLVPGAKGITATPTLVSGQVSLALAGGSDGERYDVSVRATLAAGAVGEREISIVAITSSWIMPDGSNGWLSLTGFIERFGLEETIIATDREGSRTIDRAYLIGAMRDAQAECEAFVAAHYALPLSAVPGLLQTAVADLARVRLYPRGVPDGVAAAATAQRRILERISTGGLPLPGVGGTAPATSAGDDGHVTGWSSDTGFRAKLESY
jgi:phage gp36-like protein